MYEDILLATNGGVASISATEHAVDLAADRARLLDDLDIAVDREATLHALFVVDEDAITTYSGDEYVDGHEGPEYGFEDLGEETLADVRERGEAAGVSVDTYLRHGTPEDTILQVADEVDADLVVAGSQRRPDEYRMLVGSVTERVVRASDRPVLVVKTPVDETGEPIA
ncbi:universal stress protein [Halobaculum gomorrense]|uniref:Nucleotide-binding universal stress protein, UspA family n=1 Tax=Halobaculum gomorrense TaxID=43928 RepID=A0A1M5RNH4_9EURY|nr:universal stress protein [Halobaculum gomorrense]SHH27628.1 Nucleotide-binding universal stress protein, UspA family [Halobaculum gomorrense]